MARILVVDDDDTITRLLVLRLGKKHSVEVANNGQQALDYIVAGARFDAIFCDVQMPVMTGVDVHVAISRIDSEQARRIIFMTAGPGSSAARLAKLPNRVLPKPFSAEELHAVIESFLPIELGQKSVRPTQRRRSTGPRGKR